MLNFLENFNEPFNKVFKNKKFKNTITNMNKQYISDKNLDLFNSNIDESFIEENIIYHPNNE
jgi:hypothetical protein